MFGYRTSTGATILPYIGESFEVTEEFRKSFLNRTRNPGELWMADLLKIGRLNDSMYKVLVEWVRLGAKAL